MAAIEGMGAAAAPTAPALRDALVGAGGGPIDVGPGALSCAETEVSGQRLIIVCFDYTIHQGSIGTQEAEQLVQAFRRARGRRMPIVLLLETSGIRVTDGTAGIASLRKILRKAEDARLEGIRMLAMVLKSAFGGASLLAALCERQVLHAGCLFAMSGPKLIEQSVGGDRFSADDRAAVRTLMGGAARAAASASFVLTEPSLAAYRGALDAWIHAPAPGIPTAGSLSAHVTGLAARARRMTPDALGSRGPASPMGSDMETIVREVFPAGVETALSGSIPVFRSKANTRTIIFCLTAPDGAGIGAVLDLTTALLEAGSGETACSRFMILVDAQSHRATPEDERPVLSETLSTLALAIRALHRAGHVVDVVVTGKGGGGAQGALGSGATSVTMTPRARLFVLPEAAMRALNKAEDPEAGSIATALAAGAIDAPYRFQGGTC